jgi:hypothetical protein
LGDGIAYDFKQLFLILKVTENFIFFL